MAPAEVERLKFRIEALEVKLRQKSQELESLKSELAQRDFAIAHMTDEHRVELGRLRQAKSYAEKREQAAKDSMLTCETALKEWKTEAEKLHSEVARTQASKKYNLQRLQAIERWAVYDKDKGKSKLVAIAGSEVEAKKVAEEFNRQAAISELIGDYGIVSAIAEIRREVSIPYEHWEVLL